MSLPPREPRAPAPQTRGALLRSRWAVCAAVGLIALALRLIYLWQLRDAEAMTIIIGDSRSYHEWALRIAGGDWIGRETFFQAPLYPYFLAVVYSIFGPSLPAVRLVQACLGAISCALLAGATTFLFGRRTGFMAGLLLALYPAAVFWDVLLAKSVLDVLLVVALLLLLARETRSRRPIRWLSAGAVLALLSLTRENALALIAPVLAWILLRTGSGTWRRRGASVALFFGGLALVLGPVVVRNAVVGGDLAVTTSQMGYNLYLGNNPAASGLFQPLVPGHGDIAYEAADARRLAEASAGRRLSASEVSRYWTGRTVEIVRSEPGAWLALMGQKAAMLTNAVEIGDVDMPAAYAEWSWLLRALLAVFHFGILLPLAGAGLVLSWRSWRRRWIFPALLGVYVLAILPFIVTGRYRLPMVPFLILFAAGGVPRLVRLIRNGEYVAPVAACLVAVGLAVASNWRLFADPRLDQIVIMESNLGVGLGMDAAKRESALAHFRRAIELSPEYVEPRKRMGLLLLDMGRSEEAIPHLMAVLALETGDPDTYVGLGRAAAAGGRWEEALGWYRRALAIDSGRPSIHLQVGHSLALLDRLPEAAKHYSRAAALAPDSAETHFYLGWALGKIGSLADAEKELKQAIEMAPSIPEGYAALAELYRLQRRDAEAQQYADTAARLSREQGASPRRP